MLRQAVDYVINERRRHPTDSADLLSMLMAARDEETGEGMTDEQLRVEVTTFLLAGQETTSLALTWTWYLLSQHPPARQRLEHEIDTVLGGRPPEYADLATPAVHAHGGGRSDAALSAGVGLLTAGARRRHARRLPPAAWMARVRHPVRAAPASRVLEGSRGVRSRTLLARASADRPKFVYLPFGAGPRQCIGNQFALIEAQLSVATLAQRYRLQLVPGHRVEPWPLITLRPRYGMPMIIETRQVKGQRQRSKVKGQGAVKVRQSARSRTP